MRIKKYDRWKDFAIRMARHAFPDATDARRAKIEAEVTDFFRMYDGNDQTIKTIEDWDSGPAYICDAVNTHLIEHENYRYFVKTGEEVDHNNKFLSQVSCCIRAGLDCASSPSAGVLGFTVGDLRAMYQGKIPKWITRHFDNPITAQTPNNVSVWL